MPPPFTPSPIRYRVWDGKRMIGPDDPNNRLPTDIRSDGTPVTRGDIPLLSTGLRDADGVEVFEGHTLLLESNATGKPFEGALVRHGLGFDVWDPDGYDVESDTFTGAWHGLIARDLSFARVTGHVFESHVVEGRNRHGVTHYVEPDA